MAPQRVPTLRFLVLACCLIWARPAAAHQVPFSYVDVRLGPAAVDVTVVAHVIDAAHDLNVDRPERLLERISLDRAAGELTALVEARLRLAADGRPLRVAEWSRPEPLPERQSVRLHGRFAVGALPGVLGVNARMFPYDPAHQTFLNVYERGELRFQAILDGEHAAAEYFSGTTQGRLAVVRRFIPAGIHHILIGPDHLLFLVGLLLLGGTRQIVIAVSAFTLAHSVTLSLAALNYLTPPPSVIEPAIALSIVYVGVDNLLVRGGRDMRGWIAFGFGFIHGFGFANVLREMGLPRAALGWSLFSFNLGVELGQLLVVALVAAALAALRSRSEAAGQRLAFAGSVAVIAAGTFWFVQRVFFPGGIA